MCDLGEAQKASLGSKNKKWVRDTELGQNHKTKEYVIVLKSRKSAQLLFMH